MARKQRAVPYDLAQLLSPLKSFIVFILHIGPDERNSFLLNFKVIAEILLDEPRNLAYLAFTNSHRSHFSLW